MTETESTETQPFVQHLIELRDRLMRALLIVLLAFLGLVYFSNDIYEFVSSPLRDFLPENSTMIATDVAAPFFAPFKLTFVAAVFVAMPYVLYQVWGFVSPGLYSSEKRLAVPMLCASVVLFYAGIAFAYFVTFPIIFQFFMGIAPDSVQVMPDISSYLDIALKLFFAFGFAFEIPIATFLIIYAGITTPESLSEKRPYIVVGCFVVGMLMTPPDIVSQSLLALPMWILFEAGVFFGRLAKKRQVAEEEETRDEG
jgi:sec-independent protein translocase protein TatC